MSERRVVRIRGSEIVVPESVRMELAEELAERLRLRLEAIEKQAARVDTIEFALQLAFDSAVQLHHAGKDAQSESTELIRALSQLNDEIEKLLQSD